MRKGYLLTILPLLILISEIKGQKIDNCEEQLRTVEKAFYAFTNDSIRVNSYFLNATNAAERILRSCSIDEKTRSKIRTQKNILDLYTWCLKSFNDFFYTTQLTQPLKIKFFESKVDSLKSIRDVSLQPYINYVLGIYHLRVARDYPLATISFRKALAERKEWVAAINELAWTYMLSSKKDSARILIDRCIQLEPGYARGYITLGYAYAYAKNITVAFEYFRKALSIDKNSASAYFAMGWWSTALPIDSSEYYYERSMKADPGFLSATYSLGYKKYDRRQYDLAEKYFRICLEINRYLPDAYFMIADLYRIKSDTVNMRRQYDSTILLDSSYLYILGNMDYNKGNNESNYEKAKSYYEKAIMTFKKGLLYKNDKWTNYNLGLSFYGLYEYDSCIKYFRKSVEIDSMWAEPHAWLGFVYNIQSNTQEAIEHLEKAFKLHFAWATQRYFPLIVSEKLEKNTKKDTLEAFNILKDGTREGCVNCANLKNALMFEHGFDNVEKDYEEAREWYRVTLAKDTFNYYGKIVISAITQLYESHKIQTENVDTLLKYRHYCRVALNNATTDKKRFTEYRKITGIDELLLKDTLPIDSIKVIASDFNDFGWFALLNQEFTTSKRAIEKGLELDSTNLYLQGNLPHTLLFNNETEKAKQMYFVLKDKAFHKDSPYKTFKDAFLADFKDFKNVNFSAGDIEKINMIEKILNK